MAALEEILAQIASGADVLTLLGGLLDPVDERTLLRAAVPRAFSRPLFNEVLRFPGDTLELDDLVERDLVEALPRSRSFRVRASDRARLLDRWWADAGRSPAIDDVPDDLRDLAIQLVDRLHDSDPVETLHLLRLVDQRQAENDFRRLYATADADFALGRCQDLIDALGGPERVDLLNRHLRWLREDHQCYVDARLRWRADYYASSRFLERDAPVASLRHLLGPTGPRTLQIVAAGGMGKTLLQRWFLSRVCVPQPQRSPCARVDFDVVKPAVAVRNPWLLLVEMVRQLDPQVPNSPFGEIVREHERYLPVLLGDPADPDASTAIPPVALPETVERIVSELARLSAERPAVVVLDTMEEVTLNAVAPVAGLLDLLAEVHARCPAIRLVLAGRYDLRRAAGHPLLREMSTIELEPFTGAEAQQFLTEVCDVPAGPVAEAVVARSAGLPFALGLYAEVLRLNPEMGPDAILAYDEPSLLYLVKRVIRRIQDPRVRWLLRYGVVARRLTLDFVDQVMAPHLRHGMSGEGESDDPSVDRGLASEGEDFSDDRVMRSGGEDLFRSDVLDSAEDELDTAAVWARLRDYASSSSWVANEGTEPETLVFHVQVRRPMRKVLSDHPVFRMLHEDAAKYFVERSEVDPDRWAHWRSEALYHQVQMAVPAAIEAWRGTLNDAVDHGGWGAREEVAEALLKAENAADADLDGLPGGHPLSDEQRGEAHFEVAMSAVGSTTVPGAQHRDAAWDRAEQALLRAQALCGTDNLGALYGYGPVATAEASILLGRGDRSAALEIVERALEHEEDSRQRLTLLMIAFESAEDPDEVHARAQQAAVEARRNRDTLTEARILDRLAALDVVQGQVADAITHVAQAIEIADDESVGRTLRLRVASLQLLAGRPNELLRMAALETAGPWSERQAWSVLVARALRQVRRPESAVRKCDEVLDSRLSNSLAGADLLEQRGLAYGDLLAIGPAAADLAEAASVRRQAGRDDLARATQLELVRLHMRRTGDLRAAAVTLGGARDGAGEDDLDVEFARVEAELHGRRGRRGEAGDVIGSTLLSLASAAPPPIVVAVCATGLAFGPVGRQADLVDEMLPWLAKITPVGARLRALNDLRFGANLLGVDESHYQRLADLLPADGARTDPMDVAVGDLVRAEVGRLFGQSEEATSTLGEACERLAFGSLEYSWIEWLARVEGLSNLTTFERANALADRLGEVRIDFSSRDMRFDERLADELTGWSALATVARVRLAELFLAYPQASLARRLLDQVAGDRDSVLGTVWDARAAHAEVRLARLVGDADLERRFQAEALALYDSIGDDVAYEALRRRTTLTTDPVEGQLAVSIHVRVALDDERRPVIDRRSPGGDPTAVPRPLAFRPTGRVASDLNAFARAFTHDWQAEARLLAPVLIDGEMVELEIADRYLSSLPWEVALAISDPAPDPGTELVRTLGIDHARRNLATYVASLIGPTDGQASTTPSGLAQLLRQVRAEEGLSGPPVLDRRTLDILHRRVPRSQASLEVLVARPTASSEISSSRGSQSEGFDVVEAYRSHGYRVSVVEEASPDDLKAVIARQRPQVVHLAGRLEPDAGGYAIDIGSSDRLGGRPRLIEVRQLSSLLSSRRLPAPIVVFEPARPSAPAEAVRHLLLRNAFASQLLALSDTSAIVATGLFDWHGWQTFNGLVEALADEASLLDACAVARAKHARNGDDPSVTDVIGTAAIALFVDLGARALTRVRP